MSTGTPTASMSTNLSPNTDYKLTMCPTYTSTAGSLSVNFSGPGSILEKVPKPNSFYTYVYVVINTANNIIQAIVPNSDFSNIANFPASDYTVYGLAVLTDNVNFSPFVNQPFSNLQTSISSGATCATLSSNSVLVRVQNGCVNIGNFSGTASSTSITANQTLSSSQVINAGINLNYKAAKSITLVPIPGSGFMADQGSVFKAEIGICP
jgi:hypothetical protein